LLTSHTASQAQLTAEQIWTQFVAFQERDMALMAQWQRETGASVAELQAQMADTIRFIDRADRCPNWGCEINVESPVLFFF
jgi:hypothetical protein